jgi:hypothetical protein
VGWIEKDGADRSITVVAPPPGVTTEIDPPGPVTRIRSVLGPVAVVVDWSCTTVEFGAVDGVKGGAPDCAEGGTEPVHAGRSIIATQAVPTRILMFASL